MRTIKFQELLYRAMTLAELMNVISNPNDYLTYYVEACTRELARRKNNEENESN